MVRDLRIGRGSVAHLAGGAGGAVGEGPRHRAVPDHHDSDDDDDDDDNRAVMNLRKVLQCTKKCFLCFHN